MIKTEAHLEKKISNNRTSLWFPGAVLQNSACKAYQQAPWSTYHIACHLLSPVLLTWYHKHEQSYCLFPLQTLLPHTLKWRGPIIIMTASSFTQFTFSSSRIWILKLYILLIFDDINICQIKFNLFTSKGYVYI